MHEIMASQKRQARRRIRLHMQCNEWHGSAAMAVSGKSDPEHSV